MEILATDLFLPKIRRQKHCMEGIWKINALTNAFIIIIIMHEYSNS